MKEIMAKRSSLESQGVPSFEFLPPENEEQNLLLELNRPLDDLEGMLLEEFAGREMTMLEIYEHHCVDTPYIKRNYKEVLKRMEREHRIELSGRKSNRGFADYLLVKFPGVTSQS